MRYSQYDHFGLSGSSLLLLTPLEWIAFGLTFCFHISLSEKLRAGNFCLRTLWKDTLRVALIILMTFLLEQHPWASTFLAPTFNLSGEGLTDARKSKKSLADDLKVGPGSRSWWRGEKVCEVTVWVHFIFTFVSADSERTEQGWTQTLSRTGFFNVMKYASRSHFIPLYLSTLKAGYGNKALSFCVCV